MTLDQRLSDAMQQIADDATVPAVDLAVVRSTARNHRIRAASVTAVAAAAVVLVAATTLVGGRDTSAPQPASTSDARTSSTTTTPLLTFTSRQYDLTLRYPLGWSAYVAERAWTWETDVREHMSVAQDYFKAPYDAPDGDIRVSVWKAPIDPATREESTAYLVAFAEDYCTKSGNTPCTGIADRAVALCVEVRDCHPGLLVPFKGDVQAFFSGGDYGRDAMTIVAVWRPERDASVVPYGGARKLLETFLVSMDVRPSPTPPRP